MEALKQGTLVWIRKTDITGRVIEQRGRMVLIKYSTLALAPDWYKEDDLEIRKEHPNGNN